MLSIQRSLPDNHGEYAISERSKRLATLIDADNTSSRYAREIFEEIAKLGDANVRRIYGDFSNERLKGWRDVLQSLAIQPQQQFNYTTGKNAADITLVIDAMDLMHQGSLEGYCLVSSDSDFTRLALRLRETGAVVFGFGEQKTPEAFRNACTRFIYLENLVDTAKVKGSAPKGQKGQTKSPPSKATGIIRKAMEQAWDDEDWIDLSLVGKRINQLAPDFDPRTYGCRNLVTVVEAAGEFIVERKQSGNVQIKRR